MNPTIRIDEEVYAWLQKQGRAFEDTPNSVLRRVAGLDKEVDETKARITNTSVAGRRFSAPYRTPRNTARRLCKEWNINVRHALYHRDGKWYNNLDRFPGCLMDPDGFILFRTRDEYLSHPGLSVKQQTNVPDSISALSEYVRFKDLDRQK